MRYRTSCAGAFFPRIASDPQTIFLWSKTLRAMHFLGQHFFRRTEVMLVYILLLFGAVFAYLWCENGIFFEFSLCLS